MNSFLQDLRYAFRAFAQTPAFAAIAVLTLGLGIGVNITVFGFVSALLLRPAPAVEHPERLIAIFTSDFSSGRYGDTSYPDFATLRRDADAFADMAAEDDGGIAIVRTRESVERIRVSSVSGSYFNVLGLKPAIGRLLTEADTTPTTGPVAVIGYELWRRLFGSDPSAMGTTVVVGGRPYAIVGVAPERFVGLNLGQSVEIWTPLMMPPHTPRARGNRGLSIVARLRQGSTLKQAESQLSAIAARLARDYPETNLGTLAAPTQPRPFFALVHRRLPPQFRGEVAMIAGIIMAAVTIVLVIACANVASLLLSRATARHREIAVRRALGATTWRLVRQLAAESLLLGVAGGGFGLLLSLWTSDVLPSFFPAEQARMLDTSVDIRVFVFAACAALLSSLLVGLAPALQSVRADSGVALRSTTGRASDGRASRQLRRGLVVAQVAMAVVLLVSAALLMQTLANELKADLGFGTREAALATVELPAPEFSADQRRQYYAAVLDNIRSMPGVRSVTLARAVPLGGQERRGFRMEGYNPRSGEDTELNYNTVGLDYFETLQIPLVVGRTFDSRDRDGGLPVAVVNDVLANRYFGGEAVGRHITDSRQHVMEIIGVVRSTYHRSIEQGLVPVVYYPLAQVDTQRMTVIASTVGDALPLVEPIRQQMVAVDRSVPVFRTRTLSEEIAQAVTTNRLTASLVAVCGAMALILAVIGIYGIIAYSVVRRTREIGVRVALGARPAHIVRLVLAEGIGVTALGLAVGLCATVGASRALTSLLFGVSPSDAATYAAVPALLVAVALLAAVVPARRALRVEPFAVLRDE